VGGAIASCDMISQHVSSINTQNQLRPSMRVRTFESDFKRKVPNEITVLILGSDLRDAFLYALKIL
jgi:hypothetical protein